MNESVSTGHEIGSKGEANINCHKKEFEKAFGENKTNPLSE